MSDLKSRLIEAAQCWASAWSEAEGREVPLSRLGKRVASDANFFQRIDSAAATLNILTLERFARFFGEPGNWPEEKIPEAVAAFVHVTGVHAAEADASEVAAQ